MAQHPESTYAAYSAAEYDSLLPVHLNLLEKVQAKEDFSSKRMRCISQPELALNTLSPFAILEIGIMSGKDLITREAMVLKAVDTNPDGFVQVYLDDLVQDTCRTPIARGKKDPVWSYQCSVDIVAPDSMLRLQVVDDRATNEEQIGFVEICVGDIPFDTVIEGWFELRFQESMKRTSTQRYAQHCKMREEESTAAAAMANKIQENQKNNVAAMTQDANATSMPARFSSSKEVVAAQKARVTDAFSACVQNTADKAHELGLETLSKSLKDGSGATVRNNAGELYLALRLKQVVSTFDTKFALALSPHPPVNKSAEFQTEVDGAINMQYCLDEVIEFKTKLFDDAVFCFWYWIKYLLAWRSSLLSFTYLALTLLVCWHMYLFWVVMPWVWITMLVVNSFPGARLPMTRGGFNAPFAEQGLAWVASWGSTEEMVLFVKRLAFEDKLKILDQQKLRFFCGKCVRDGKPTVGLNELRTALRKAPFVSLTADSDAILRAGDLVWIDGRDRGKVVQMGSAGVTVALEAIGGKITDQIVNLETRRVTPRLVLEKALEDESWRTISGVAIPPISNGVVGYAAPMLNGIRDQLLQVGFPILEDVKFQAVPAVEAITDILTWKRSAVPLIICTVLFLISVAFGWAAWIKITSQVTESGDIGDVAYVLVTVLRNIDNAVFTIVWTLILIGGSWWLTGVKSVIKILAGWNKKRPAPGIWAFYREDRQWHGTLEKLEQQEAKERGPGMFHLPYMTREAGTAYATAGGS